MNERLEDLIWSARQFARKLWLVVRNRPFFTCPFCEGHGGEVSGYDEPEWSECRECYDYYADLDDHGWTWFVGRLPLFHWLRAKVSKRFGLWYTARVIDVVRCKCGRHQFEPYGFGEHGDPELCHACWEMKPETTTTDSEVPSE